MSYPVLCGAVVLTSANNRLRFREAAGAVGNVDLDVGTYYLRGGYTTNLLTRSEDITDSVWLMLGSSGASRIANVASAPSGATTADKYSVGTGSGSWYIANYNNPTIVSGQAYTFSVYVKAAGLDFVFIRPHNNSANLGASGFIVNLTNGSITYPSSPLSPSSTGTAVAAGNGWWRITATSTANASTATGGGPMVMPAPTSGSMVANGTGINNFTGDGVSGVYIWGAQLEAASTAGPYVATTTTSLTGPVDELSLQIKNKLDAFGVGGNAYDVTIARSIDPLAAHTRMTITRSAGTDTFGLVVDGSQTFDMALIGFPASTLNDALPKVSPVACAASWACNDVAREIEPVSERVVAVPRAVSGRVQGVTRSARMQSWRLGLAFVAESRMLTENALTGPADALESFMERFGANASLELHEAQVSTGTTLGAVSATTFVDVVHFSEDALSRFEPVRIGPGVPLYSLDLRLHAKV